MVAVQKLLATFGNGYLGRLGHGFPTSSELFPRIVASLAGYSIKQVACGGAHTAVVTGARVAGDDGSPRHGCVLQIVALLQSLHAPCCQPPKEELAVRSKGTATGGT